MTQAWLDYGPGDFYYAWSGDKATRHAIALTNDLVNSTATAVPLANGGLPELVERALARSRRIPAPTR
jgi:hypothetical protein